MPESCPQHDLEERSLRHSRSPRYESKDYRVSASCGCSVDPPPARKHRNRQQRAETRSARSTHESPATNSAKAACTTSPPKHRLHGDTGDRDNRKPSQPAPVVFHPNQNRQRQRENSQTARNHAVRVLEKRPARQHSQRRKPRSKRFRPVGNRQRGVVGGNQRPGNKKQNRPGHYEISRNDEHRDCTWTS